MFVNQTLLTDADEAFSFSNSGHFWLFHRQILVSSFLFNIYIKDLFFLAENTNADDTTFYAYHSDLAHDSVLSIVLLVCNNMKQNQDKCHLLISGHKYEGVRANISPCKIWENNDQKFFGFNFDRNLKFSLYILKPCKKAGRKLSAVTRFWKLMIFE